MQNVTKRKAVQKKSTAIRSAAERKRLDEVEKKHGGKKAGGMDTVVVRKSKATRKKTDGGMKTKTKRREDFIDGKTGKIDRKRK